MSTPATVEIWESNGAGEVPTKITGIDLGSSDQPNLVAANHPLVIPGGGSIYSYQKYTRWKVTAWVDTNTIDNLKWFKSAGVAPGSGWFEFWTNNAGKAYATPDRTGASGNSTWPLSGAPRTITGTISNPTTGYVNAATYVYFLVGIDSTAAPNAYKGAFTITYRYDEA